MSRLSPTVRKAQILKSAMHVAERDGYRYMSRKDIASHAGVSEGMVSHYLGTMTQLRRTVMRRAVKDGYPIIVAQGIVAGDKHALKAPIELRQEAVQLFLGE